jgi:hypothetical protein
MARLRAYSRTAGTKNNDITVAPMNVAMYNHDCVTVQDYSPPFGTARASCGKRQVAF